MRKIRQLHQFRNLTLGLLYCLTQPAVKKNLKRKRSKFRFYPAGNYMFTVNNGNIRTR